MLNRAQIKLLKIFLKEQLENCDENDHIKLDIDDLRLKRILLTIINLQLIVHLLKN